MNKKTSVKKAAKKSAHPDHSSQLHKLNRAEGQIAGVKKMIEDQRYCPDITHQVRATRKALFAVESELLKGHMNHCVATALSSKSQADKQKKLDEILQIFKSADSQGIEL